MPRIYPAGFRLSVITLAVFSALPAVAKDDQLTVVATGNQRSTFEAPMMVTVIEGDTPESQTATSLYLAMQFGIHAANYPFIADDMDNIQLPAVLKTQHAKLFGLTIDPERLAAIREERRENSRYASLRQCRLEVAEVEALFRKNNIRYLNSTNFSVEELATKIIDKIGLNRRMY